MSSDYSSFDRDYFRKQKRREDSKSSKISPKQVKVYEPKSAQKSIKTQGYADESEQSSCYEYGYYTNYTKSANKKTDMPYTSQGHSSSKTKQRGNDKFKVLNRDEERNKDNEDAQKDKSFKREIIWVPASKSKVSPLLDEKPSIPYNSNPTALASELERSLKQDLLITSAGHSTTATREDRKPIELFNFSQDRPDPIQMLKASREKERLKKGDVIVESTENITRNKEDKNIETERKPRAMQNNNEFDEDKEINAFEENDGTNYSDIDNMVEEKLLTNQIEPIDDDIFNQVELEPRETLEALEDKNRPVWEDIDTQKVLKDIKNSDSLDMFSQRIKMPNKNKQEEATQSTSNNNFSREEQLKDEDKEDYFEKIFSSFEIREEPLAVMPGIFNLAMKFSSDKQPQDRSLDRSNSMCSRSFDLELIERGTNSYKPLPAFKNHRSQNEANIEISPKESNNYGSPNSTYSSQIVFGKLIPNNQAKVWHYRDLEGILQGPFSSQIMDSWYNKGYLPLDLAVTLTNSRGFKRIQDLVEIASNIQSSVLLQAVPNRNNGYNATQIKQHDNDLDETENEINNSIENIISENCCPNANYNYGSNGFTQNAIPKALKTSLPYYEEPDRLYFDCSNNKPYQVPRSNQFQGFDYNRNYLRNLPR